MNRRSFLAALVAVPILSALPAWAAQPSIRDAILSPDYRTVWITVSAIDDREVASCDEVSRVMVDMKRRGHPISVTILSHTRPTLRLHHNTRNAGKVQSPARPWGAAAVRYAVVYQPEQCKRFEDDMVNFMRMCTASFIGGKVIVVSREAPPADIENIAHFKI